MIPATRVLLSVFLLSTIALAQSRVERNIVYGTSRRRSRGAERDAWEKPNETV
jgi:hypothetical protein